MAIPPLINFQSALWELRSRCRITFRRTWSKVFAVSAFITRRIFPNDFAPKQAHLSLGYQKIFLLSAPLYRSALLLRFAIVRKFAVRASGFNITRMR